MTSRRTPLWIPFLTNSDGFDTLATTLSVHIDIASIMNSDLGMELAQYTTQRVIFTFLLENQTVDIQVGVGMRFRTEGVGASTAPKPVTQVSSAWQYHEYVVSGSTADFPTEIRRDVAISRRNRNQDESLQFSIENLTGQTIAYWLGGRALILRQ